MKSDFVQLITSLESLRSGAEIPRPESVRRSLFWKSELEVARFYGVAELFLERVLGAAWWREIPPEVREEMRKELDYWERTRESVSETREHMMNFMVEHEVQIILLGATDWAYRLFPHVSWRAVGRLQFLIAPRDFFRALRLLGRAGYRVTQESGDPEVYILRKVGEDVVLEVRSHLCGERSDEDRLAVWERSERIDPHVPQGARRLAPTDQWAYFLSESRASQASDLIVRQNDETVLRENFFDHLSVFETTWRGLFDEGFVRSFLERQSIHPRSAA